jgi:hypothetical protein
MLATLAEAFAVAAAFLAFIKIPYSIYALRAWRKDPRIRLAMAYEDHAVPTTAYYVRLHLYGTVILIINYSIRTYAHLDPTVPAAPAWSYFLSMFATTSLLVVLWAPAVRLLNLKARIVGARMFKNPLVRRRR